MRLHRLVRHTATFFMLSLIFAMSQTTAQAQSEIILGRTVIDDWTAAVPGDVVDGDFESLVDLDGQLIAGRTGDFQDIIEIQNPQQLEWGQLSTPVVDGLGMSSLTSQVFIVDGFGQIPFSPLGIGSLELVLDDPSARQLEGFAITFRQGFELNIQFFDGDELVDSFLFDDFRFRLPSSETVDPASFGFGWINTDGLNITRIVLEDVQGDNVELGRMRFSFTEIEQPPVDPPVDPPVLTCFDQLSDVLLGVEELLAVSEGDDAAYLQCAASCIQWSQDDVFWVQPSGDRLTAYGGSVFIGAAYTVLYLERVEDPQSDVLIDELLAVLECLVEREIEYAIANGGHQCFIDRAVDFAELAEIIDDDFDNQVVATLAYRLAWLHAFYSTY